RKGEKVGDIFIVMIVFGSIVLALAVIGSTILIGLKILKGGVSQKGQKSQSDEARIIQEIYQGLTRMEERVESLETILLERERKEQRK
ncbi:MAG: hypothetical protein JXL81_02985, partial [Deltaproteobacteria bacterium]|nr:hypothetical protein [Deltaproteobacteria bacterium]